MTSRICVHDRSRRRRRSRHHWNWSTKCMCKCVCVCPRVLNRVSLIDSLPKAQCSFHVDSIAILISFSHWNGKMACRNQIKKAAIRHRLNYTYTQSEVHNTWEGIRIGWHKSGQFFQCSASNLRIATYFDWYASLNECATASVSSTQITGFARIWCGMAWDGVHISTNMSAHVYVCIAGMSLNFS